MRSKREPNLRSLVQRRLTKLTPLMSLQLADMAEDDLPRVDFCAGYIQGVRLNDSVAIILDAWGHPENQDRRYTFTIFARPKKRWCLVEGHIEEVNEAVTAAIRTLVEQA